MKNILHKVKNAYKYARNGFDMGSEELVVISGGIIILHFILFIPLSYNHSLRILVITSVTVLCQVYFSLQKAIKLYGLLYFHLSKSLLRHKFE